MIFQHDGAAPIEEPEVEGLSKIFRSTKGAASVGFMGIGFKSVFGRFREARISGWGWTFRYEIDQSVGEEYGDVQTDPLGAVMPIWDQGIECPEEGFTTRFELRMPRDESVDLSADLGRFVSNDDLTPLAILAESGLERLDVDGSVWDLCVDSVADGTMTAIACAGGVHRWQLFSVEFQPSPRAIRRFLEHRRIQPREDEREKVYEQAARKRRVLGVLPLDDRCVPVPPERGRIYATLPTEVTLPFGIHVNADWLLNISRMGLGEIEDAWQREIVDRIADVLARVLDWVSRARSAPDTIKAGFAVLASPSSEAGGIEAILAEEQWLSGLHEVLRDRAILPVWADRSNAIAFAKPNETLVPPTPLAEAFEEEPALGPAVLLNGPVLAQTVLGSGATGLLRRIDLLRPMTSGDLERAWAGGLQNWWRQLDAEQNARRDLLFRVWGALAMLTPEGDWSTENLRCVRTESGQWQSARESAFINEHLPSDDEPGGSETRRFIIQQFSPTPDHRVADAWIRALRGSQQPGAANQQRHLLAARKWIETHARSIGLQEMVESAIDALMASRTPDWDVLVPFGCWAMHRNRPKLLTHVVVDEDGQQRGVAIGDALLADPYVRPDATGRGRRLLFPSTPAISAKYLDTLPDDVLKWRTFFEEAGARGALRVRLVKSTTWEESHVAEFLGLEAKEIDYSTRVYTLQDFDIRPVLPEKNASSEARAAVAAWLDDGFSVLRGKGRRRAEGFYYKPYFLHGANPSTWVETLSELEWVPCSDRRFRRPDDVLPRSDPARQDVPVAELSPELVGVLEREGMY